MIPAHRQMTDRVHDDALVAEAVRDDNRAAGDAVG